MKTSTQIGVILTTLTATFIFCEFLVYYVVLMQCKWPELANPENDDTVPIRTMILADPHLLGPYHGHWWDKLRREWQMHRSFQTAMSLFRPELVFILGDLFDEGHYVDNDKFANYVTRFHQVFLTPPGTQTISIVGNHDVGFHYRMHPFFTNRFGDAFNNTGVSLHTIRGVHFVTINSMAMEGDGCYFCEDAEIELNKVSDALKCMKEPSTCKKKKKRNWPYTRPIIMQHFPTYRPSDKNCIVHDSPIIEAFRENWEVLSKESTAQLGKSLNPRLAFSGHSHHFCYLKNSLNIEEYSVASFSWRNKNNPSFLLATFTPESHAISVCYMPQETTVISIYIFSFVFCALLSFLQFYHIKYGGQTKIKCK